MATRATQTSQRKPLTDADLRKLARAKEPRGKPSAVTRDQAHEFLFAIACGDTKRAAAKTAGTNIASVNFALANDVDFNQLFLLARRQAAEDFFDEGLEEVRAHLETPGGPARQAALRTFVDYMKYAAEKADPERFGSRPQTDVRVPITIVTNLGDPNSPQAEVKDPNVFEAVAVRREDRDPALEGGEEYMVLPEDPKERRKMLERTRWHRRKASSLANHTGGASNPTDQTGGGISGAEGQGTPGAPLRPIQEKDDVDD